jgi:N-methylhydantoinase A/oxoprolinase/acetone carboxylase beta subunit
MKREGFAEKDITSELAMDLRYSGQSYEITVPTSKGEIDKSAYMARFHKAHQRLYSYHHPDRSLEIVNIRLRIVGLSKKAKLQKYALSDLSPQKATIKKQELYFYGKKYAAPVYDHSALAPGNVIHGPALVCALESTTFLPPLYKLSVDCFLNLVIEPKGHKNG